MEINKERIEKVAKLMSDGLSAKLHEGDNENIEVTPAEFTIALAVAAKAVLLNMLDIMKKRVKLPDITDKQLLEAFGTMMPLSIDEIIEIAQKYDQE